jgi:Cu-Zn family superoxide dismutase
LADFGFILDNGWNDEPASMRNDPSIQEGAVMARLNRTGWALTAALLLGLMYGGLSAQEPPQRQRPDQAGRQRERVTQAVAVLQAAGDSGVRGTIHFTQRGQAVEIKGRITGLTPGKHGFHIHQYGDLSDMQAGKSAGDHFNPAGHQHGRPDAPERHAGDLGNVEADEDGVATIQMRDSMIRLNGPQSILGRSVVVHAAEDKFTQPSGDAGDRIALGVIGIANPESTTKPATQPAANR